MDPTLLANGPSVVNVQVLPFLRKRQGGHVWWAGLRTLEQLTHCSNTTIKPMIYRTLLERTQSRTFYLQRRIQESDTAAMNVDKEVEEVITQPEQVQLFT